MILVHREEPIAVVQLNRPEALNALSPELMLQLVRALEELDHDNAIKAIVITGSDKAFAAGADIKEMAPLSANEIKSQDPLAIWDKINKIKKPLIAAVSGYTLGGGCELAMMCDIIVASETTKFGQPEINLGIIPGAGGTQRLVRAVGKSRAMEWILIGNTFNAQEALAAGLVSKISPAAEYLNEAKKLAQKIAEKSPIATSTAKQAILKAMQLPLEEGLKEERRLFYQLFDTEDQKEGMKAFMEKRKPNFTGKSS
ncbi:MAG: enoyl-CoA hydratase [Deltaproteobacteria bacterium RIFCSPLOWO2_02_FULL_46_8]|nr:MAG: enoyl-CoA hydratase [Deltaproteobacteria bacterium RIFCSPLOWO2_02_FULL_46_8]